MIEHFWDLVEQECLIMNVQPTNLQQVCHAILLTWTKNIWSMLAEPFFNLRHEELRQFLRQKGVQHSISKMYTIKWPYTILYHYWQSLIKLNNKFISSCEIKKFSNYDPIIKYVHKCSILHIEYFNLNTLRMILGYNCCSIATGRLWLLLTTVM